MRNILIISLFTVAALAGCVDGDDMTTDGVDNHMVDLRDPTLALDLMAGDALWTDHQDEPHPSFGWPTLSNPAPDAISWHTPIEGRQLDNVTTGLSLVSPTSGITQGAGLALYGSLAVVPGYGPETAIVDIRDPTDPQVLSTFAPQDWVNPEDETDVRPNTHRGATVIAYPDGRIVTAISTGRIIDVWDITDPTDPQPLPYLEPTTGSHKVGVVPGTPIVYNAASGGSGNTVGISPGVGPGHLPDGGVGITEIFDLSDPLNPVHVQDWQNGYACHHVYFWNDADQDKQRAICAGIEYTQIWDTADPLNPEVIVSVPFGHGYADAPSSSASLAAFSHFAGLNADGTVLLVGDESGGGSLPPGCVANVDPPAGVNTPLGPVTLPENTDGSVSTPVGALWFYDITDETKPILQGWYSATRDPRYMEADHSSCTAHHGRLIPSDDGRDLIAMSFYGAGVHIVDFSNPQLPFKVDSHASGSDTWETWYYNGYLFTGDLARGMEVFTVDGREA